MVDTARNHILWFSKVDKSDIALVGEKGAYLGELTKAGFLVPEGFIITANVYYDFLRDNNLSLKIKHLLSTINYKDVKSIEQSSLHIRKLIKEAPLNSSQIKEIISSYEKLGSAINHVPVDITTSETAIDETNPHILNPFKSYTNLKGDAVLLDTIKESWSSLFDAKSIFSRYVNKLENKKIGIALVVQKSLTSDKSGTISTHSKKISSSKAELSNLERDNLTQLAEEIRKHSYFPQEVKWLIDEGKIYILGTRLLPDTQESKPNLTDNGVFLTGLSGKKGISSGPARLILSVKDLKKVVPGEVLVVGQIVSDLLPYAKKANAIIAEDNQLSQLEKINITTVIGVTDATKKLKNGLVVTVNGTKGEIYKGGLSASSNRVESSSPRSTVTKIYVNLADSGSANLSSENVQGVGEVNLEHLIKEFGIHPKKLIKDGKENQLIEKLADELKRFCKAFPDKPVIYQISNLQTYDYKKLTGGNHFEPEEITPLLGFRGAFRYIHDSSAFELEIKAVKKVREEMGYENLSIKIPFVRTPDELKEVKRIILKEGLSRSESFKIWMNIELPSNVLLISKFLDQGIDGIFIDADNLTTMLLGIDKQDQEVSNEFNEMDPSVLLSIESVINKANEFNVPSLISGQGILMYSEHLDLVVKLGITGVSVSPFEVSKMQKLLAVAEKELLNK